MSAFIAVAVAMLAVALSFVLPVLLRRHDSAPAAVRRDELNLAVLRDQLSELDADRMAGTIDGDAYDSARRDLTQRAAEDVHADSVLPAAPARLRRQTLALGLAIVLAAASLYTWLGTPAGLDPARVAAAADRSHEVSEQEIVAMVERLAQRLKSEPDNAEGWLMLARSYAAMRRFGESSSAYAHVLTLMPRDAQVLVDYADTLAMTQGQSMQGEPEKLLVRALALDPKNVKAHALMGSAAFERRDYAAAILSWQSTIANSPADSEMAKMAAANIQEAQAVAAGKVAAAPAPAPAPAPASAPAAGAPALSAAAPAQAAPAGATLSGSVDIDPALRAKASDTDTVFLFARALDGPRFPLAVLRKQVKDLPFNFVLDDTMSMTPGVKLSGFASVVVGARVSKSGNAVPSTGDLEGFSAAVAPGSSGLKIRIGAQRN